MDRDEATLLHLQRRRDGVSQGLAAPMHAGRFEIVTAGPNAEFAYIGSDPFNTNVGTGLVVPAAPSASIGGARYTMLLARARFGAAEAGVRLVGVRQYAELVARVPVGDSGEVNVFRREIEQPIWHPPDGNISWHVMVVNRTWRDTRNPLNTDGVMYQDSLSPALLYQTLAPYTPPFGGRLPGKPLAASLGNMHDLRYRARGDQIERALDVPIPVPCDVLLIVSVRQNDPATNPIAPSGNQFTALTQEDQFLTAFNTVAQYGVVYGGLVFSENVAYGTMRGEDFSGGLPGDPRGRAA